MKKFNLFYLLFFIITILLLGWIFVKNNILKEAFISNKKRNQGIKLLSNPYYHGKKTLKSMISAMANDALQNKLKNAPTLVNMEGISI